MPRCLIATCLSGLVLFFRAACPAEEFRVPWAIQAELEYLAVRPLADAEGNTVLVGAHYGDPLPGPRFGDFTLPPLANGNQSIALAKADASGNPLWLRTLQVWDLNGRLLGGAALTAEDELVIAGSLYGSVTIAGQQFSSPGNLTPAGFIAKIRQDGSVIWVKFLGSPGSSTAGRPVVDQSGNIYVTGGFQSTISLDEQVLPGIAPEGSAGASSFLAKLSPSGNLLWMRAFGNPGFTTPVSGLSVDAVGNVYLAGYAMEGTHFGEFTLSSNGDRDAYVVRYSSEGVAEWLFSCGSEISDVCQGLAINDGNELFITITAGWGGIAAETVTVGNQIILPGGISEYSLLVSLSKTGQPKAVVPFEGNRTFNLAVATDWLGNAIVLGGTGGPLTIGNRSVPGGWFVANITPDGTCRYVEISPVDGPIRRIVTAPENSLRVAASRGGYQSIARIDLPVLNPFLHAKRMGSLLRLSWPAMASGFVLQTSTTLENGGNWQSVGQTPVVESEEHVLIMERETGGSTFFRLQRAP